MGWNRGPASRFDGGPQAFIGYWGRGDQRLLEQQLGAATSQWQGAANPRPTRPIDPQYADSSTDLPVWGVAQLDLRSQAIHRPPPSSGAAMIAAATASGLWLTPHADGFAYPDAWAERPQLASLTLGRDPFGRVPLYWLQRGTVLWFATQLRLLLPLAASAEIDLSALYGYACFSYVPTPLTPVKGIQAVSAGEQLHWDLTPTGELRTEAASACHWQRGESPQTEEAALDQLQSLLKAAVARQLDHLPAGPVGVFLSGGLDSSLVAALLVQAGVDVRAYTLDFGREETSEWPYAQQVAQHLGIPLVRVEATAERVRDAVRATAQALDLPFGDSVTAPLFLLNQAAAQEVSVVFNGENGDQLFAGWTNKPLIAAGLYTLAPSMPANSFEQQYLKTFHRLYGYESQAFTPAVYTQIAAVDPCQWLQPALDGEDRSLLQRLRRATLLLKGAQNIQPRATQLAFAHGLSVRSPFCDWALTEWSLGLNDALCLRGPCEKYVLKRVAEAWLPAEVVWREKRGMGVPLTAWCFNPLWSDLGRWLNPAQLRQEGLWLPHLPEQVVAGALGGVQGRRVGEVLWLLVMWQQWRLAVLGDASRPGTLDHPFWLPRWLWQTFRRQA